VVEAVFAAIDSGRATRALSLYADGALLQTRAGTATGEREIAAVLAAREANAARVTRHVLSAATTAFRDPARARVTATLSVFVLSGADPTVPEVSSALDVLLERDGAAWRISRQHSTPLAAAGRP
jgi:uncharacterized protein (TIGR02246 family)